MKQLTQQLKSGKMEIMEVPYPALGKGLILVKNFYSAISAGTEGKTVTDARKSYLAKAQSRQKEVKQVIEMIKTNGFWDTYKLVMNKLEAPSALGYSCAGKVIAVGEGVTKFKIGDFVACGGSGAMHAEIVAIPVNLAVKIPENVELKEAAFTTIAAIAIQGIRQAELQLGSNCLIIGMGLIGQITYKILQASGIYPVGIDVAQHQLDLCKNVGISNVYNRNQNGIEDIINAHSKGYGVDAIIITAGSSSLDPVEFAGVVARRKAKVVIVGAVPTGFSRVHYYKKELDLRMSSSYGPGRYDLNYEEKGIDYPIGYVRFTQNRNMESFIDLLASERIEITSLITHSYVLNDAPKAYDMILSKKDAFSGIVINYNTENTPLADVRLKDITFPQENPNVGFVGAGSFAQNFLLPNMKGKCNFIGVATGHGNTSKYVADKYAFNYCTDNAEKIFSDTQINTVFIATRHNLHAENVLQGIKSFKHVFVEKPLAMNQSELNDIKMAYDNAVMSSNAKHLMVGFNRRFAPPILEIKKLFDGNHPKSIIIRVNSGVMPLDHWVNDPDIGGGRIIGEACHFIDLAMHIAGSPIISVAAEAMKDANNLNNTVVVNLKMQNGSIASVSYFANGNKNLEKEYIEVYSGGTIAKIVDFQTLEIYSQSKRKIKYKGQNKGHKACVTSFLNTIDKSLPCPIPFTESYNSMLATFKVNESILTKQNITI